MRWSALIACVALTWSGAAGAQPGTSVAKEQFQAAQKRYDAGDYAGAVQMFQEAWENSASPNARLYVARSLRELGKLAAAYHEMEATYRDAAQAAAADSKYNGTRDAAALELQALGLRVGRLSLTLHESAARAAVELDGRAVHPADLGKPQPLDPGVHKIVAKLDNQIVHESEVEVRGGDQLAVAVAIPPKVEAAPPLPAPEPSEPSVALTTVGFVTAGLGVGALGAALGTGLAASSDFSKLEDECGGVRCTDPDQADVVDRGEALETASLVTLIAGSALTAAGAALVIVGFVGAEDGADHAGMELRLVPGGVSMSARF